MSRTPQPWYRPNRKTWYVTIAGKQHNLGPDKQAAWQRYYELMAKQPAVGQAQTDQVAAILDLFLEWTEKHRAPRTYRRYQEFCQSFLDAAPANLTLSQFKPYHIQQWLDVHPNWNGGNRRKGIMALQRAFRWAQKMGYIDRSSIEHMEKPPAGKRDEIVTPDEFQNILSHVSDAAFTELLTVVWETGCRPQEAWRVEARHVDLDNARWVFKPSEAKVKTRPRIVYLPDTALAITKRNLERYGDGHLFRNTRGTPWQAFSVNCRFGRLQPKVGRRYCLYLFRHSFATRLLEAGVDALTVAILLGHANPAMLSLTYQHLDHNAAHLLEQARKAS